MGGDGGDSDDGGYGIPSQIAQHCHRHRLSPQPQAAGSRAQALHKGSPEGKFGTRSLLARCSVLHPAKAGCKNRDGFFSPQGWLYEPKEARKAHACTERLRGVLPQGGRAQMEKHCHRRHACHPKGKTDLFHFAVSSVTGAGGIPTSLSLLSSLSHACFVSAISLPSFFLRYA